MFLFGFSIKLFYQAWLSFDPRRELDHVLHFVLVHNGHLIFLDYVDMGVY